MRYRPTADSPIIGKGEDGAHQPSAGQDVRLLHVVSHPIHYFAPLYRHLASRPDIDLTVAFYSDGGLRRSVDLEFGRELKWDVPLIDGYRSWFLRGYDSARRSRALSPLQTWDVAKAILAGHFDAVWIHGYNSIDAWLVVGSCHVRGIPVLIRDDATLLQNRSALKRLVKTVLLPILFHNVYGLCVGAENRKFFERYGVRDRRLFFAPHSVDNDWFRRQLARLVENKSDVRVAWGLPPSYPVVLFCGKLVPRKDPLTLLRAFGSVRRSVTCSLLLVGDGSLREEILEVAKRERIPDVKVCGFLNQSEIFRAYAAADIIVLPSRDRETWGLVVNEAMNFGLAVVVSDHVGCSSDLVIPGENGFIVPVGSTADLADALHTLVADRSMCRKFGERSREIVDAYDVRDTADAIAETVVEVSQRRRSAAVS